MSHLQNYDAIVIGSGIGGLTVAAILSKFNGRFLIRGDRVVN